jgi:hypothetical protein
MDTMSGACASYLNEIVGNRQDDQGPSRRQMELGPLSGRSLRPQPRPKSEEGGMVTGSRAQISGTKFSGTF